MSTASKRYVVEWREPLVDVRELLLQRLQSRQDHQKPPRLHWLQDQLVPILAEDSFVAFELEVPRDSDCLVAPVEQSDTALGRRQSALLHRP